MIMKNLKNFVIGVFALISFSITAQPHYCLPLTEFHIPTTVCSDSDTIHVSGNIERSFSPHLYEESEGDWVLDISNYELDDYGNLNVLFGYKDQCQGITDTMLYIQIKQCLPSSCERVGKVSNPLTGTVCKTDSPILISEGFQNDYAIIDGEGIEEIGNAIYFNPALVEFGPTIYTASLQHLCDNELVEEEVNYHVNVENCFQPQPGCTDPLAVNYDESATYSDNTCNYEAVEEVTETANIEVSGSFQSENAQGYISDWTLTNNTLFVNWIVFTDEESFVVQVPYEITSNQGLIVVELVLNITQTANKTQRLRIASESARLRQGVRLGKITGLSQEKEVKISVYPQPATTVLHIATETSLEQVSVFTQSGQQLFTIAGTNHLDVSNLKSGMYILKTKSQGKEQTTTFSK